MRVKDLYNPVVVTADADESLASAAGRMVVHGIGSLAVLNDGQLAGVAIGAVTRATKKGRGTRCLPRPNR